MFCPQYKNGNCPRGKWYSNTLWSLNGWTVSGSPKYDIGVAVTRDIGGQKISERVGRLGLLTSSSRIQHWNQFGYPAAPPFTGNLLVWAQSSYAMDDVSWGGSPMPIGVGNDMTPGCSGGPWVVRFNPVAGKTNYLNGVNSYGYRGVGGLMFSPYFGTGAENLFDVTKDK
jgi:hypothetical protein